MRWRLVNDDDGHWYVIPNLMLAEWYDLMDEFDPYTDSIPTWANRIDGGPECISFSGWMNDAE